MKGLIFLINCLLIASIALNCQSVENINMTYIDFQGHRGCRGLLPENSIPAFLKALEYPIKTLEMDAAISKDGQVIISHDPWFNPDICTAPDNLQIDDLSKAYIQDYTYEEIKQFDCGSKGNEKFSDQKPMSTFKPSLSDVVQAVNDYCDANDRESPYYNIEIKSGPDWDSITFPVDQFADILIKEIVELGIKEKACIQSFDIRALQATKRIDPEMTQAFLVFNQEKPSVLLEELGFVPEIYSPFYRLVNAELVSFCKEQGMLLIPWTVNDLGTMEELIDIGVDGIITDYPNLIEDIRE